MICLSELDFITSDISKVGECEFFLISEMNCQLIVHHPYRTLTDLQTDLNISQDEVTLSWSIINDHYMTDIALLFPPHVMAVTAIFLALVLKPTQCLQGTSSTATAMASATQSIKDVPLMDNVPSSSAQAKIQHLVKWLAESEIDIKAMIDCTQEIISLYDIWERYSEKTCKEQMMRFMKARGLDK